MNEHRLLDLDDGAEQERDRALEEAREREDREDRFADQSDWPEPGRWPGGLWGPFTRQHEEG